MIATFWLESLKSEADSKNSNPPAYEISTTHLTKPHLFSKTTHVFSLSYPKVVCVLFFFSLYVVSLPLPHKRQCKSVYPGNKTKGDLASWIALLENYTKEIK